MAAGAWWIAAATGAALTAGCFDFAATSDGVRSDGGDATSSTDGGGGADATTDASENGSMDATPVDAVGDGGAAETGTDAGPFCATFVPSAWSLFFCADFDEGQLPGSWQTWDTAAGSLKETDASAVSPPNSLEEVTDPLGVDQPIDVALRTPLHLPPVPSTLKFAFSLEPLALDETANATIVLGAIDFLDASNERYSVELSLTVVSGAATMELGEQSMLAHGAAPYLNHALPPSQPLAVGSFTDIVIEIQWTATSTATGIVTINGGQELSVPLTMTVVPTSLQVGVGTSYVTEPSTGWELRYDNIVFTAK